MDAYYQYRRQYRTLPDGVWQNTAIYSVDGWQTQEKVVAMIDPSECDEYNVDDCKVTLTLKDCSIVCIPCDGRRTITREDLGEYKNRAVVAEFGCCIDTIDGVFQGDIAIQKVIIPDCITAITEASFYGTDIHGIVFPESITYIGSQANKLAGLKWARFLGTVPPTLAAPCSLGGNCPIYVPAAYVDIYKSATIWNQYTDRILPWEGQVETDYEIDCDTQPPTPTVYYKWKQDPYEFECAVYDKYHVEYQWSSATGDEGSWSKTGVSRMGSLWEANSEDCGYVPPTPVDTKYTLTLTDGTTVTAACDSSSSITNDGMSQYKSQLASAVIGDCVTGIGVYCFSLCNSLSSVTLPDDLTGFGGGCFSDCISMSSITIPSGVTSIEYNTFTRCSGLTSVNIPNSVTYIGPQVFDQCYSLTSVTIGSGVTEIRYNAFRSCGNLTSIKINATTPPTLGNAVFQYTGSCPIIVPCESVNAYKAATNWFQHVLILKQVATKRVIRKSPQCIYGHYV